MKPKNVKITAEISSYIMYGRPKTTNKFPTKQMVFFFNMLTRPTSTIQ